VADQSERTRSLLLVAALNDSEDVNEVLRAAEGLSNREIGQKLFVSPRTVSTHLYRIYPKLGISARGKLASALEATP
jgi:DNA-binding NarL/FixJ family response regulator